MLRTTSGLTANKSIFVNNIIEIGDGKVIEENSSMQFGTRFLIPGAKLAFAKLQHAFSTTPILYHFDAEYHI